MIKGFIRRILPFVLSVAMAVEMVPITAFAAETDSSEDFITFDDPVSGSTKQLYTQILVAGYHSADVPFIKVSYKDGATDPLNTELAAHQLSVLVNGVDVSDKIGTEITLSYKWQKANKDDVWSNLFPVSDKNSAFWEELSSPATPCDVGKYICTISIAAVADVCSEASLQIPCEITRHKLTVYYYNGGATRNPGKIYVLPGSKVSDFIVEVQERVHIRDEEEVDKSAFIRSVVVTLTKGEGENAEPVGTSDVFQSTADYFYSIEPVLYDDYKSKYEVGAKDADDCYLLNRAVLVGDAAPTKILVTVKDTDKNLVVDPAVQDNSQPFIIGKQYNAKPTSAKKDILPLLDVHVQYDSESDPETKENYIDITDDDNAKPENLDMEWWDSGCSYPLGKEPTDAGTYALCISYKGKKGIYKSSGRTFIRVKITAQEIYVKPNELNKTFYTGMMVRDVVSQISYQVRLAEDDSELEDIDLETFWGVAAQDRNYKQAYAPLFGLRCADKGSATDDWQPCDLSDLLEDNKKYIAVFTGKKALLDMMGEPMDILPVNQKSLNSACSDYDVLVGDEILLANSIEINVEHAEETEMDITGILKEGKGKSFAEPIVSICDGKEIYQNRADYKKAVVTQASGDPTETLAEGIDSTLSYRWQVITDVLDSDGNPEPCYEYMNEYGVDSKKSPYAPGLYRLEVTYSDPSHVYASSVGYVYYEIRHRFVMIEPAGSFTAYTETSVGDFLNRYRGKIEYDIYKVADNAYTSVQKGEAADIPADSYSITWSVESSEDDVTYVPVREDTLFEAGHFYRLRASLDFGDGMYADHYIDYTHLPRTEYRFNVCPAIQVVSMGTAQVSLEIHADAFSFDSKKAGQGFKVYDGEDYTVNNIDELVSVLDEHNQEITDFPKEQLLITWRVEYENGGSAEVSAPRDAGAYTMFVSFPGNKDYAKTPSAATAPNICRIGKRDLTVTPVKRRNINAGDKFAPAEDFPVSLYRFDGVAESDKDAFRYRKYTCYDAGLRTDAEVEAVEAFVVSYNRGPKYADSFKTVKIYDEDGALKSTSQRYKSNTAYYACTELPENPSAVMAEPYLRNYRILNAKALHTAAWVGAQVSGDEIHLRTESKNGVTKIIPSEGLPYFDADSFTDLDGNYLPEGNYFTFRMNAPAEFNDPDGAGGGYNNIFDGRVLFKNAIQNAGGTITELDGTTGGMKVVFPVKADTGNATFEIVWQDKCTEKFEVVLSKALLCSDTSKAVLPKSMKFNGASTKMAVGEVQQLNLTVVKKQISDVIRIGYSVSDTDILSVTGNGSLTALKPGKATVSAYPIKIVGGAEVKITDGKAVNLNITVGSVAKPALTKVSAVDNIITVRYKKPSNGYRREFYVLEGKKTAEDFEALFEKYEGTIPDGVFAIAPLYGDGLPDSKPGVLVQTIRGSRTESLKHDAEYTVYVRNVSGARTLYNGSVVSASSAGAVKTVKTTKESAQELELVLDEKYAVSSGADYKVSFSEKSVTASIYGIYHEYLENEAAEKDDWVKKQLPLTSKEDKEKYISPKISCYVTAVRDEDDYMTDAKQAKTYGYTVKIGNRYYYPSKIASVNSKGTLTLKGLGKVRVWVYSSVNNLQVYKDVMITADVDSVTGKSGKTKIGQRFDVNTLLVYQAGGKKVTGNPADFAAPRIVLTESEDERPWFIDDAGMFVATKKGKYTVKIEDAVVKANGGEGAGETSVTINVSDMEPVKALKKVFVYDAYAKIRFSYSSAGLAGTSSSDDETAAGVDFRVDVRDSAGKLVYSQFLDGDAYDAVNGKMCEYFYVIDGLSRRSSYKVQVTAFYENLQSKPASLSFKTTGVPASYVDMNEVYEYVPDSSRAGEGETWYRKTKVENAENGNYDIGGKFYDHYNNEPEWLPGSKVSKHTYQGVHIDTWGITEADRQLDSHPFFTSGSSYVLSACEDDLSGVKASDLYPKEAKSDTLVWKVKNSKIASVKALKGSFSAKLKAGNPGTTTLEVSSKNTKKVIARYLIMVKPVGDGHDYFGDYDDYYNGVQWDPTYEKEVETLYVGNPLTIDQADNEYVWVSYEAKESGIHTFGKALGKAPTSIKISDQTRVGRDTGWDFDDLRAGVYLYEGMQIYMKVEGSIEYLSVSCTPTVGIGSDNKLDVKDPLSVTFTYTAKEAGCYTFSSTVPFLDTEAAEPLVRENSKAPVTPLVEYTDYAIETDNTGKYGVSVLLRAGVTIRMKVKGTNATGAPYTITVSKREYTDLGFEYQNISIAAGEDAWLKFEAPDRGEYIFMMSEADAAINGYYYNSLNKWKENYNSILNRSGNDTLPFKVTMQKGDNIAFRLTPENAGAAAARVKMLKFGTVSNDSENIWENVGNAQERWYTFTASEDGVYGFRVKKVSGQRTFYATEYEYTGEDTVGNDSASIKGGRESVPVGVNGITEHRVFTKGETVVFKIFTGDEPALQDDVSSVSVKISQCQFAYPGEDGAIEFDEEGYAHYQLTASADGVYGILIKRGIGSFQVAEAYKTRIGNELLGGKVINTVKNVALNKDESLYYILQQDVNSVTPTGTITMITDIASGTTEITTPTPVNPGGTQWFAYTIPKAGRYYISGTSDAGGCSVTWYYGNDTATSHVPEEVVGDVFKSSQAIYIKVTKDNVAGKVTVKVEEKVPVNLSAGETRSDIPTAKSDRSWYQFKANANQYYQFDYSMTGSTATPYAKAGYYEKVDVADVAGERIDELTSGVGRIIQMDSGDALDFHFYDDAASPRTATMKVGSGFTVDESSNTLTMDSSKTITLPATGSKWYKFKASDNGMYTFAAKDSASIPIEVDAKYYVREAGGTGRPTYVEVTPERPDATQSTVALQKNDEVLISIAQKSGSGSVDIDFSVSNMQIITIYAGETQRISIDSGKPKYVQFRIKPDAPAYLAGIYFVKSSWHSAGADVTYSIKEVGGASYPSSNNGIFIEWLPDRDYNKVYEVTTDATRTESCYLALDKAATELVLNQVNDVSIEKGRYAYAYFTAPDTDYYTFYKETSHAVTISGIGEGANLTSAAKAKEVKLERGSRWLLKLDNTKGTGDVTEKLRPTRTSPTMIELGETNSLRQPVNVPARSAGDSTSVWYALKAKKTARYAIACEGADLQFNLYNAYPGLEKADGALREIAPVITHAAFAEASSRGKEFYLAKNEVAYLRVKNSSQIDKEGAIRISVTTGDVVTDAEVEAHLGDDNEFEATWETRDLNYVYFSFTAEEDGFYEFHLENITDERNPKGFKLRYYPNGIKSTGDPETAMRRDSGEDGIQGGEFVPAGKTVILRNDKAMDENSRKLRLTIVHVAGKHSKDFGDGVETVKSPGEYGYDVFGYNVVKSGTYKFSLTLDDGTPFNEEVAGIIIMDHPGIGLKAAWESNENNWRPSSISDVYLQAGERVFVVVHKTKGNRVYWVTAEWTGE